MAETDEEKIVEETGSTEEGEEGGETVEPIKGKKETEGEEEPPTRSKPWSNREERAEFFSKKDKGTKKETKKSDDEPEELTPQARKLIEQEVERRTAPLRDEIAFRDYFGEHPEDKKFQAAAKKRYEAWPNTPIEEIMKTLRPSTSTEEKSKAEEKATRGSMKGGTARAQEGKVATTQKEFEQIYKDVKRGNRAAGVKALGITD